MLYKFELLDHRYDTPEMQLLPEDETREAIIDKLINYAGNAEAIVTFIYSLLEETASAIHDKNDQGQFVVRGKFSVAGERSGV